MNTNDTWQRMQTIVHQNTVMLSSHTCLSLQQFSALRTKRLLADNLFVFLMQYIGLKLSLFGLTPSPLWLATGSSCAYLFLRGASILPGIWLGTVFGFYFEKIGLRLSLECACIFTLQAWLLLQFSYRYLSATLICTSPSRFLKYILFTSLLTAVISLISVWICYPAMVHKESFFQYWIQWWLANLNGIIIISSAILTWDAYACSIPSIKKWKIIYMFFSGLIILNIVLVFSHTFTSTTWLTIIIILLTILISTQFGWCGAVAAVFFSGIILSFAGFMDAAVFSTYPYGNSLFLIQLFLSLNAIIGLSIATRKISRGS